MKQTTKYCVVRIQILCAFLLGLGSAVQAQSPSWQRIDEGLPLSISAIAARNTLTFSAVPGYGVYSLDNTGVQWQSSLLSPKLTVEQLQTTSFGALLTGFEEDYTQSVLYLYENSSWSRIQSFRSIAVTIFDAVEIGGMIVLNTENGVISSNDKGKTWSVQQFPQGAVIRSLVPLSSGVLVMFAENGKTIVRSTDGGKNWSPVVINTGAQANTTYTHQTIVGSAWWLVAETGAVYRSPDDGKTWASVSNGLPQGILVTNLVVSGSSLLLSTQKGEIYKLSHSDVWTPINSGLPSGMTMYPTRLVANGNGWYLAPSANQGGIYKLNNNSDRWEEHRSGLPSNAGIMQIISVGENVALTTSTGELFISSDKGASWKKFMTGIPEGERISSIHAQNTTLIAGTFGGALYRSINGGLSWSAVNGGIALNQGRVQGINNAGTTFIAGIGGALFISGDNGNTWKTVFHDAGEIKSSTVIDGIFFIATTAKGVLRSENNGITWTEFNTGLSQVQGDFGVVSLSKTGTTLLLSVEQPSLEFRSTYKTQASKADWQQLNNYLIQASATGVQGLDTLALAGTISEGVFRMYNGASDWQGFGLENPVNSLWMMDVFAFAGTSTGLYRVNVAGGTTGVRTAKNGIPKALCFPNPAFDATTITFDNPAAGTIALHVVDVGGRLVKNVPLGYKDRGTQTVNLDLKNLPEGVYSVSAVAGITTVATVPCTVAR